ncbi:hypothetical protein F4861DRAFT_526528 [Xylaria intraflava]|nr:hypothetical protein F4861DRAFT_526528 [Xylaria intraflava]
MQHVANSSQQFVPQLPASLHTPTQSFSETLQTPSSQGVEWADRQAKEHEFLKSRLTDHKFNIRDYPDPLLPRQEPPSQYYPQGVTAVMEKHLLEVVSKIKAKSS